MAAAFRDAWRVVARQTEDPDRSLPAFLVCLTVVTGLVDAFSYLTLGHVFVANMTGNVVFLGFALAGVRGFSLTASLVALGAFALGALWGGRLGTNLGARRTRLLATGALAEAVLVAVSLIVAASGGSPGSSVVRYTLIILLSLTMGGQNAVARKLAVPDFTTTVLTLTITGMFADSRTAGGSSSNARRRLLSPLAMFVGALAGHC